MPQEAIEALFEANNMSGKAADTYGKHDFLPNKLPSQYGEELVVKAYLFENVYEEHEFNKIFSKIPSEFN